MKGALIGILVFIFIFLLACMCGIMLAPWMEANTWGKVGLSSYEAVSYGPMTDRKDWEQYYIHHATFTFINPKWIRENEGKLTTEWDPSFEAHSYPFQIGYRSDGVVVWRKSVK